MRSSAACSFILAAIPVAIVAGCAAATSKTAPSPRPTAATIAAPATTASLNSAQILILAELLRMEDMRVLDTALVRRAMLDRSPYVRGKATLAAGRVGDHGAVPLLRDAARDADDEVAADAAFEIGELGDTTSASLALLHDMLFRPTGGAAAREAARAMGKLVRTSAYSSLLQGLQSAAPGATASTARMAGDVVPEALLAIWHHPRQAQTTAAVIPFATSPDINTRFAAVYSLARAPRPAAIATLIKAASDTSVLIRETAIRGLRAVLADSVNLRAGARAALVTALADTASHVRINALGTLAGYRDPALAPAFINALNDRDTNVRIAAAGAMAGLQSDDAYAALVSVASAQRNVKALAGAALASAITASKGTYQPALDAARAALRSNDWLDRLYAVRALAAAPYANTKDDLRAEVRDADPRVQAEALGDIAAADTADTTHTLDALYLESLASADPIVRTNAISALGRHRDVMFLSALMDAYARSQNDREDDAALAAVDALAALAQRDSAVTRSFFLRFQRSNDPLVRASVARQFGTGPGSWGTAGPSVEKPVAWYESVVRSLVAPVVAGHAKPRMVIHSDGGDIVVELASDEAPLTVQNFIDLISAGYFTRSSFHWHRVVPNFVLQDGDPRGDGSGGPGFSIRDEINRLSYTRGAVGMALSGPDTGGSQFFITHSPQPHLDGGYTVFGYVVSGMDIADRVIQDDSIHGMDIIR